MFTSEIKTGKIVIFSNLSEDNYKKYTEKFITEFLPVIKDINALHNILQPLLNLKSWRLLNREIRKACNQYCFDNNIMSLLDFQEKFFYEGVMLGRKTWGLKSEWITDTDTKIIYASVSIKKEQKNISNMKIEEIIDCPENPGNENLQWNMNIPADVINKKIYDTLQAYAD